MQEYIDVITQVGFPICVAGYLLLKTSRETQAMIKAINELIVLIREKL